MESRMEALLDRFENALTRMEVGELSSPGAPKRQSVLLKKFDREVLTKAGAMEEEAAKFGNPQMVELVLPLFHLLLLDPSLHELPLRSEGHPCYNRKI